jgi:bifunctional UDP-N-acetylglucosamine pyrophosphorylase/glucosamine-1-phosphate N-acetyltransferase
MVTLGITETNTPDKYGIVDLKNNRVCGVVEKPEKGKEPSNMRLIGTYLFSKDFLTILSNTPLSNYSLELAIDKVAKDGKVGFVQLADNMPSLKYPWDLLDLKDSIFLGIKYHIEPSAIIEKTALLKGDNIFIGKNTRICDFSIIEAPAYIGDNVTVGAYSQIRGGTILEDGVQIERYADVKSSVIGKNTHVHSGFIGDSVIGKNCRIGAEFVTANKRLDRRSVGIVVKGEKVDSGKNNIGVFMGNDVKVGIRVSTMPGTVVGDNSNIYPGVIMNGFFEKESDVTK